MFDVSRDKADGFGVLKAGLMDMNRTGSVRDERDERLERAGYLLVVGIDHLIRTIATVGWHIVRFLARRSATAERRSEGRTR
jgi:hypothetical protein